MERVFQALGAGNAKVIMCGRAYMLIRQKACVDGGWGMRRREEQDKT